MPMKHLLPVLLLPGIVIQGVVATRLPAEPMSSLDRSKLTAKQRNAKFSFLDYFNFKRVDEESVVSGNRTIADFILKHQQKTSSSPTPSPAVTVTEEPYSIFLRHFHSNWRQPNFSIKTFQVRHGFESGKASASGSRRMKGGESRVSDRSNKKTSKKSGESKRKSGKWYSNSSDKKMKKRMKRRGTRSPSTIPTTMAPTARLERQPAPTASPDPAPAIVQDVTASPSQGFRPTAVPMPVVGQTTTPSSSSSPTMSVTTISPTPNPTVAINTTTTSSTVSPTMPSTTILPTAMPTAATNSTTLSPTMTPTTTPTGVPTSPQNSTVSPTFNVTTAAPTTTPNATTLAPTPNSTTVAPAPNSTTAIPTARPTTVAPTPLVTTGTATPTTTPTPPQPVLLPIPRFYIAFVAPGATRSPTDDEYNTLTDRTATYFSAFLNDTYADNDDVEFESLDLALNNTRFQLGIPNQQHNIYMDFVMDAQFSPTSTPDSPAQIFNLLIPAINANFILNEVRMIADSPFTTVNEATFAAAVTLE